MAPRLLKPRTPIDCPACCFSSALLSVVEPEPASVRPWHEVKSSRGAPKRVNILTLGRWNMATARLRNRSALFPQFAK